MSSRKSLAVVLTACASTALLGGCRQADVTSTPVTAASVQTQAPLQSGDYIPQSTVLSLQLMDTLGTEHSKVGDRFSAAVINEIRAADGSVVVPRGTVVTGIVTQLKKSGHVGEHASIGLGFESIAIDGRARPLAAEVVETQVETTGQGSDAARGAGAGALGGAALGAILGGGSGALKGGLAGAAGGSLIGLGAGGAEAKLAAGTTMTIRTVQPIDLTA